MNALDGESCLKMLEENYKYLVLTKNKCEHFIITDLAHYVGSYGQKVVRIRDLINITSVNSHADQSNIKNVKNPQFEPRNVSYYLSKDIKRVSYNDSYSSEFYPCFICERENNFFSVVGRRRIMNHHPFELLRQYSRKSRIFVRETVISIGSITFWYNQLIKSVVIPPSVEFIGKYAFHYCQNLKTVKFSRNSRLRKIGFGAFQDTAIFQIEIPSSVESIGRQVFNCCSDLKLVSFAINSRLKKIKDSAFSDTMIEKITIPASVEIIGDGAFYNSKNLSSVIFAKEARLKEIERWSFASTSIESIDIPSSVESVGFYSFGNCEKLSNVTFHFDSNLRSIDNGVFWNYPKTKTMIYAHFLCLRNFFMSQFKDLI